MIKKDYFILALVVLFFISCSSDKINPFGLDEVASTSLSKVYHLTSVGSLQEQTVDFPVSYVKNGDDLLIGKYKEIESAILIKFGTVTDDLSDVTVKRVSLFLSPKSKMKEETSQPLSVDVHSVTMTWDQETIEPLDVLSNYDLNVSSTGLFPDSTTIRDSLELGTSLVQSWVDKTVDNNGLLLLAPSADHMAIYSSEQTSEFPLLKIVYEDQSQTDSSFFAATEATSVIQSSFQLPPDRLAIGSGDGMVSYFKLDYEQIPKKATINRAFLELHVDSLNSIHQDFIYEFTQLRANTEDWLNFPGMADSSSYDTTHYRGGDSFRINLKNPIQDWVNRLGDDFGFRFAPLRMGAGLFRTVIFSSTTADTLLRPKLEIYYSLPPEI
jgi:hypothetical protein